MSGHDTGETVKALYAGTLPPGQVAQAMMTAERLFPTRQVAIGPELRPLPEGPALPPLRMCCGGRTYDLVDYLALNRVTGLLILHQGGIRYEGYELGLQPMTRHASFSLAKSVCSTLIGCALQDRSLTSLDQKLGHWLAPLRGSAYADVSLRSLLAMRTGIAWDETYTRPDSDRRRFLEVQLTRRPGSLIRFMAGLAARPTGEQTFNYSTGETFLVGAVLEAVTGQPLANYLSDRLWQPLGMQSPATWWVESPDGAGMGGSGLSATLRDYGRFAQFVLEDGVINGRRVVPEHWFADATRTMPDKAPYGYQWWLPQSAHPRHAGAFMGMGIFGQRLYLKPKQNLAIVVLAARSKPSDSHVIPDEDFFGAVAEALAG